MTKDDRVTAAVARAVVAAPVTLRELARRAGISHALLHRIAHRRVRATERVAAAVVKALEAIAAEASAAARDVSRSTRGTR